MDNTDQIPIQASIMNRLKMHNITINTDQSLDFVHGPGLTIDQEGMCYAMNNKILKFLAGPSTTSKPHGMVKDHLRILDIHDFISDMVLLHTKNKAVSLKVANKSPINTLMSIPQKRQFLANFRVIYI